MSVEAPRLIVPVGLPFAGKSLMAQELFGTSELSVVTLNKAITSQGIPLDGRYIPEENFAGYHEEAEAEARSLLREGKSVYYDVTPLKREQRDKYRELAKAEGAHIIVVYSEIIEAESRRRWEENNRIRRREVIHLDNLNYAIAIFEPPIYPEPHWLYNGMSKRLYNIF